MTFNKLKQTYQKAKKLAMVDSATLTIDVLKFGKFVTTMISVWVFMTFLGFYMLQDLLGNLK